MDWLATLVAALAHLGDPLKLLGFVLLLFFVSFYALVKKGLLRPPTQRGSERFVNRFFLYAFIISVLVIILGFFLALVRDDSVQKWLTSDSDVHELAKAIVESRSQFSEGMIELGGRIDKVAAALEQVRQLLADRQTTDNTRAIVYQELAALKTEAAEALLDRAITTQQTKGDIGKRQAANSALHIAALAEGRDPAKVVTNLQRAARLDPDNPMIWGELSQLLGVQEKYAVSRPFSIYHRIAGRTPVETATSDEFTVFNAGSVKPVTTDTVTSRPVALYTGDELESADVGRAYGVFVDPDQIPFPAATSRPVSVVQSRSTGSAMVSRENAIWTEGEQP